MTTHTHTHDVFTEVAKKLDDKSIDLAAVWATGFSRDWRHYIITDDGEYGLISDHDFDVISFDVALCAAYKELALPRAKWAKKHAAVQAKLANARPVITAADAARIQAEWERIETLVAGITSRRNA